MEDAFERKRAKPAPVVHTRFPTSTPGATLLRANIAFRAIANAQDITLTQQVHCDLQSLPCQSHYNCVDQGGNPQDGCSHYNASCTPDLYFTMQTTYYYLLLPTTNYYLLTTYYLLLRTTTYYYLLLPTTTYYYQLLTSAT